MWYKCDEKTTGENTHTDDYHVAVIYKYFHFE